MTNGLTTELSSKGYWPAVALEYLSKRNYSKAIELCQLRLREDSEVLSGRTILARALYHSGQLGAAEQQLHRILRADPYNVVALRYLGDLKFRVGEEATALTFYQKVCQLDPSPLALASAIIDKPASETRTLTLRKSDNKTDLPAERLRQIPFKTETLGDLLLAQGHPRLAMEIFRGLAQANSEPQLLEKIDRIESLLQNKEKKDV